MEVLHGSQADSKYSRRRSDRHALASNRLLDWSLQDSDIALLPHSPLALAEVLTQKGGNLVLVPEPETDAATAKLPDSDDDQHLATSQSSAMDAKHSTKQCSNLLTKHAEAELRQQCKKVLVENALIKNKGDRQLYLAAGFISWTSAKNPDATERAPLLLYPALLVRIPSRQSYELRFAGDTPEFNIALVQHLEQRHNCALPPFEEDKPLADFFAQIAESIQKTPAIALEFDVALGSAAMVSTESGGAVSMPDIPKHFDAALAMSITGNKSLEHLSALLQLIPDFNSPERKQSDAQREEEHNDSTAAGGVGRLRRYAAKLAAEGLDHIEFKQLPHLPKLINQSIERMLSATSTGTLTDVLKNSDMSARELIKLSGIIELIDKAPDTIAQKGHGDLCYASSTILLRRAQHQAKLIEDELKALQEHFHLDKVPAKPQLLNLISELGGSVDNEPDFVDAGYFNARRQFMEFSTHKPANLTTEHQRLLSQLAKVFRFRELFVNNVEYRLALGKGYKGLRTEWQQLLKTSDYCRELADVLGSERIAASIISNWDLFRHSFVNDLETFQHSADATRQLLSVLGNRWQTQSISALATHAALIATRLEDWRNEYGSVEDHADKSAAVVLSSFSGPYMDHVLVETQVDETQARIRQQLADGEILIEQISDTLSWLTQASATASENNLDIDTIVEHLQTA